MTTLRTAAQQALEALEYHVEQTRPINRTNEAIDALRAALAEYDKDRVKIEEMKANWALQRKLAEETQERDKQQREYEEQRLAALAEPVQEPVAHSVIAGALFDIMGWLTSRRERIVLSSADNASPAVEAITEFAKMRGLSLDDAKVQDWNTAPPQRKPLTEEEALDIARTFGAQPWPPGSCVAFARAIERAHGIGGQP